MAADLYTRVFERAVFPLLDRANGTTIAPKLALLRERERDAPARIADRQAEALRRAVASTRRRSAFYREHWLRGDGPRSEHIPLDRLPVVTKRDLAAAGDVFPLGDPRRALRVPTSGSTGRPMVFFRTREQESWFWAQRFQIWRWAGYRPGDRYLTINLNPRLGWRKKLQDRLFRCSYLTYNADNQDSRRIVDTLRRRRIGHLNGFSSSLYVLARHMLEHGLDAPEVRGVTATGDALYPTYRETIERAFGVRVLDYYGAGGEGLHLASQCPESGDRYHLLPENAVVELLGADGPVAPGERGRLVVTQLHNDAMPLVRYELGDLAVAAPPDARCACGRTLPLLERVEGRVPDLVAVPDGTFLVTHFFVVLFKHLEAEIAHYQVHQREPGRMTVRLVGRPGCRRDAVEDEVRRRVADATRGLLEPVFDWVDEIPLAGAGKRRLVISELSPGLLGQPAADGR